MPMTALTWMIGCYVAAFCCLIVCAREGKNNGPISGLIQLLIFLAFAFIYWALESWANVRAPFYTYPPNLFTDMIPALAFSAAPVLHPCAQTPSPTMSATVPLAGASITFGLMWTMRLLLTDQGWTKEPFVPVVAPPLVGLVAFWLDGAIDPILAESRSCVDGLTTHPGLGFWIWHADASLGADYWFGVPLFNYGVWYAGPGILVALAILVRWIQLSLFSPTPTNLNDGALRAFILLMMSLILYVAPSSANAPGLVFAVIVFFVLASFWLLVSRWPGFKRNNPVHWELLVALGFYFLYPLLAFLFSGEFAPITDHLTLLGVSVIVAGSGIYFVASPYWKPPWGP